MTFLLELTGPNHKEMVKEAILGKVLFGVGKLMGRAGKVIVKNPGKTLNTGVNISSGVGTAQNLSSQAALGQDLGAAQSRIFGRTM